MAGAALRAPSNQRPAECIAARSAASQEPNKPRPRLVSGLPHRSRSIFLLCSASPPRRRRRISARIAVLSACSHGLNAPTGGSMPACSNAAVQEPNKVSVRLSNGAPSFLDRHHCNAGISPPDSVAGLRSESQFSLPLATGSSIRGQLNPGLKQRRRPRAKQSTAAIHERTPPFFALAFRGCERFTCPCSPAHFGENGRFICFPPRAVFFHGHNPGSANSSVPGTEQFECAIPEPAAPFFPSRSGAALLIRPCAHVAGFPPKSELCSLLPSDYDLPRAQAPLP